MRRVLGIQQLASAAAVALYSTPSAVSQEQKEEEAEVRGSPEADKLLDRSAVGFGLSEEELRSDEELAHMFLDEHERIARIQQGRLDAVYGAVDIMRYEDTKPPDYLNDGEKALLRYHVDSLAHGSTSGVKRGVEELEEIIAKPLSMTNVSLSKWYRYVVQVEPPLAVWWAAAIVRRSEKVVGKLFAPMFASLLMVFMSYCMIWWCVTLYKRAEFTPDLENFLEDDTDKAPPILPQEKLQ